MGPGSNNGGRVGLLICIIQVPGGERKRHA